MVSIFLVFGNLYGNIFFKPRYNHKSSEFLSSCILAHLASPHQQMLQEEKKRLARVHNSPLPYPHHSPSALTDIFFSSFLLGGPSSFAVILIRQWYLVKTLKNLILVSAGLTGGQGYKVIRNSELKRNVKVKLICLFVKVDPSKPALF